MSNNSYTFTLVNTNGSFSFTPGQIKVNLNQPCGFTIVRGATESTFKEFAFSGLTGPSPFSRPNVTPTEVTFTYNGQPISGEVVLQLVTNQQVVTSVPGAIINA